MFSKYNKTDACEFQTHPNNYSSHNQVINYSSISVNPQHTIRFPQTICFLSQFPQELTPNQVPPNNYVSYHTPLPIPRHEQVQQNNYYSFNTQFNSPAQNIHSCHTPHFSECPYYMTEIQSLAEQDSNVTKLLINNLAMHKATEIQYIYSDRHDYKSLVKQALVKFNLSTLKQFAIRGIRMHERTFNRLLITLVAKLQKGEAIDDLVDVLINKWYALTVETSIDNVVDMTPENLYRALGAVNFNVIVNNDPFCELTSTLY